MLKLKTEAPISYENIFRYEGKPFNGVLFQVNNGRVLDAAYIQNGLKQKPYLGDYVKVLPGEMCLDADCEGLEGDREYEIITFKGAPFDGVLYEFDSIFCIGESYFSRGIEQAPSVTWHRNGILESYSTILEGVGDAFEWYDNGRLKTIFTIKNVYVDLLVDLDEDGQLQRLSIHGQRFFETPRSVPNESPFATIIEFDDLKTFKVSRGLFLSGEAIDSDVFDVLESNGLELIEVLKAFHTSLGDREFGRIGELPRIRTMMVDDQHGRHANVLSSIKQRCPYIEIQYNNLTLPKLGPMLRVKFDLLTARNSIFYFEGDPFAGIAFETMRGQLIDAAYFEQGVRKGDYKGDYIDIYKRKRLEADCEGIRVDPVSNLIRFRDELYTGILYEFRNNLCTAESLFVLGAPVDLIGWFETGLLASYSRSSDGFHDVSFNWFETGNLRHIRLVKTQEIWLTAEFSTHGELHALEITKNYFTTTVNVLYKLPFAPIQNWKDLGHYRVCASLSLRGSGVGSGVFQVLRNNEGFERVEEFNSFNTVLTDADFRYVGELPGLREINVNDENGASAHVLRDIKTKRSHVKVAYNHTVFE